MWIWQRKEEYRQEILRQMVSLLKGKVRVEPWVFKEHTDEWMESRFLTNRWNYPLHFNTISSTFGLQNEEVQLSIHKRMCLSVMKF